jgi:two-component system, NarL family, sensor kinase
MRGDRDLAMTRKGPAGQLSVGWALGQFALVGILVLLLLGSAGLLVVHRMAVNQEVTQAQELTVAITRQLVEPALTDALLACDPEALHGFDALIKKNVLGERVVRVKLWTTGGRIVYSDKRELQGDQYPLARDAQVTLRTGHPDAAMSEMDDPENELERKYGRLLEVYTRVNTPTGTPLLFETYLREKSVLAASNGVMWSIVPAIMLGLGSLLLLQMPLAWRLVRRVQLGQRESAVLQRRALEASDHERRRIARDLHDGVIQSLAGVSYSVAGTADRARAAGQPDTATQLDRAAAHTRSAIAQLRSLIADIYPPSVRSQGLRAALVELLATVEKHGLQTSMDIAGDPPVAPEVAAALYRAAQEALRNVIAHAGATDVHLALVEEPEMIGVVVDDNGAGPADVPPDPGPAPHGLRLLGNLASEVGGRLEVARRPEGGTRFTFMLPTR